MATATSDRACALLLLLPAVAVLLHGEAARSSAGFPLGGQATVRLPPGPRQPRFAARAVVLDDAQRGKRQPGFVAAVSAEAARAAAGACACSLVLLLGGVKVWASDHLEEFVARALCRLELTEDGQLRLTDGAGNVGWLSGTAGLGVKALRLDGKTGNLVLVDAQNRTMWQSLDNPTDKFLRDQHRTLPAYFVASMTSVTSSPFYSLELDDDKIAAYIHVGYTSYSYWERAPTANRTMASARLDGSGLKMLDAQGTMVAQVSPPVKKPPLSFLALGGDGNLEMYYYDARHRRFRVSYKALGLCELPLSCGVREVCSAAGKCKDIAAYADRPARAGNGPCYGTGGEACMVHLRAVTTVLRTTSPPPPLANVTLRQCVSRCASNLSCNAALYVKGNAGVAAAADHGVCEHYTLTAGAREVSDGSQHRYSYWVKLPAAAAGGDDEEVQDGGDSSTGMLSKVLMICGAIDVVCAVVFAVLITLYFRRLRRLAATTVNRAVELQQGETEGVGEQNSFDSYGAEHN
ncbi:putative receptor protein kinase ZmPK1 [Panicum miliaceum]|uniref:non-specific serine/threonine protein kinase n=1 Tax=Panicum miliaceum TaxID=4540 RepID=A0A3L6SGW2_PANMI|nr:putative receptor protein kinase ZmPK1 [Panicum miliaceum]